MFTPPTQGSGPGGAPIRPRPVAGRGDSLIRFFTIPVFYLDGIEGSATSEGNNASWLCICKRNAQLGTVLPILGRCYYAFGHICHSVCSDCGAVYRVWRNADKRAIMVVQEGVPENQAIERYMMYL